MQEITFFLKTTGTKCQGYLLKVSAYGGYGCNFNVSGYIFKITVGLSSKRYGSGIKDLDERLEFKVILVEIRPCTEGATDKDDN